MYRGVQMKWSEPPEARQPDKRWCLYVFRGSEEADKPIPLHRQSAYLVGRERAVADIPVEHPSCSKQHAVVQFRQVILPREAGDMAPPLRVVKPYVLDLESTNGTKLNGAAVPPSRYVELRSGDVLQFGESTREFVLLHDGVAGTTAAAKRK